MAKYFKLLIMGCCLIVVSVFSSCQEGGEAGDFWGQWRLDGSDTKYINFSGHLTLFRSINEGEVFGKFQHTGDSLFIQCYSIWGAPSDTTLVENTFGFKPFTNIRLKIETFTSDRLVLSKGQQTWSFYKY
ncbi:MAG: hypothetical protein II404_12495 [Prevotella sp.]|nr:hypothetical protein [Prevotella sp.]